MLDTVKTDLGVNVILVYKSNSTHSEDDTTG